MPVWSRDTALLTMTSPLGADALIPIGLSAREAISQLFLFEIRAVSQQGIIDPDKLLYQPVCVTLQNQGGSGVVRHFHGVAQSLTAEGKSGSERGTDLQGYTITVVPRLWFLGQTVDCRVYQKLTTVDILQQLFQAVGLTDVSLPPPGAQREYTVQFNETDLQFASRLMEEEGYFYFFEHTAGSHKLIVTGQSSAFTDIAGANSMHLGGGDDNNTLLTEWSRPTGTTRGKMKFKDYDPENPDTLLQNEQPTTLKAGGATQRDDFRWPALTFQTGTVTDRAKREMEAAEAAVSLYEGASTFGKLVPGGKFTIVTKPSAGPYDGAYVVNSVTHHAIDETWLSRGGTSSYDNHFAAFPAKTTWRQPLVTPRPRMEGVHTALVLGPQHGKDAAIKSQDGEEIHTDDMGRVKVRFYWDHRAEATGGDAVWARVIQPWAGKGWGSQFIPRVGTEVAVAFVDGDPDRPIVIGGLYNGRDTPIYSKADKNKLGFRTRSVPKGSAGSNFSEFTIDDTKGSELVFFHAEKDLTTEVENDQTLKVDNCRIVTVKKDETVDIQNNQTIKVKQDHKMTVTNGNHDVAVSMGNMTTKVAMGNHSTDVQMGNVSLKAGLGKIDNEAMQSIELKVGQSSVKIDQMGVTITGMMIKIQGQVQTQIQGTMTQVNGDAMLMLKGGITMIN
jgi:type VI secretion system secreted protein VgrG